MHGEVDDIRATLSRIRVHRLTESNHCGMRHSTQPIISWPYHRKIRTASSISLTDIQKLVLLQGKHYVRDEFRVYAADLPEPFTVDRVRVMAEKQVGHGVIGERGDPALALHPRGFLSTAPQPAFHAPRTRPARYQLF